jgi:hypothetical protein
VDFRSSASSNTVIDHIDMLNIMRVLLKQGYEDLAFPLFSLDFLTTLTFIVYISYEN